jgi:NaMN:DMB phosphoribosyltransferase
MERFERNIANTHAEVERRRKELNSRTQQGAECPPTNTTSAANIPTAFRGRDAGLTVPRGMWNTESIMKREKHVATRIIQFVKSDLFCQIKFVISAEMFQKAFEKV